MSGVIFVGLGGALGAVCRYMISLLPMKGTFPVLTLVTNVAGAILIGFIVGVAADPGRVASNQVLFWKTGVCGGFTTFSTFSLEAMGLLEQGNTLEGAAYIALSVCLCIAGVYAGRMLSKIVTA